MEWLLEIDKDDIFKNDKLNREPYIKGLMNVFEHSSEHKVIAINAPWGTGKTSLIRLWEAYLDKEKSDEFIYVIFNAWENDDLEDPLMSLTLTISEQLGTEERKNRLVALGGIITRWAVKGVSRGVIDLAEIDLSEGITNDTVKALEDVSGEIYKSFVNQKNTKQLFKDTLSKLCEDKKLIIFVDELDRCRPTFAIETLERIKHFFDIENCYFVLAVDREQLGYSIKTIYGNEMDTAGYLRRFFDVEVNMQNMDIKQFFEYRFVPELYHSAFRELLWEHIEQNKFTLREIDKLYELVLLIYPQLKSDFGNRIHYPYAYYSPYVFFMICKIKYPETYLDFLTEKTNANAEIGKIIIPDKKTNRMKPDGSCYSIPYHRIVMNVLEYRKEPKRGQERYYMELTLSESIHIIEEYFDSNNKCNIFNMLEMFQIRE